MLVLTARTFAFAQLVLVLDDRMAKWAQTSTELDDAQLLELFTSFDLDGGGTLEHDEVCALCASLGLSLNALEVAEALNEMEGGSARPSLIPSLCTHFTRARIEWRR